ncbi:MAG: hypothetical protein Kow0022_12850 [Phycisphaerales bacterium]
MKSILLATVLMAALIHRGAPAAIADPASSWDTFIEEAERLYGPFGRRAAAFLAAHRPEQDRELDSALLLTNLEYALKAREEFAWARTVPDELFFNDVLPYAVFDETRENWRPEFYAIAKDIVRDCGTATEAIQALNRAFFDRINVHYNTGRKQPNQSPSESIAQGRATCTGLSIILVDACRAVGIPARAAGVASWHDKRGNHTWVEAWDGRWHFTGADEFDPKGLDRGWFTVDASKATPGHVEYAVWATSWKDTGHHFPMVWNQSSRQVHGIDVTERYRRDEPSAAPEAIRRYVRVWRDDERVVSTIRVRNAGGQTIATLQSKAGTADLNDMPSFAVPPGERFTLEIALDDAVYVLPVSITDAGEQTLDLHLSDASRALSRAEANSAIEQAWQAEAERIAIEKAARPADTFVWNGQTMPVLERVFGDEPEDGRSLWISMHGGGGAPAEVNDQQWRNQIRLYEPDEGIVVAPRAPTNTWNLWHQSHIDPLFEQLIATYVATRGVDPDKVYLLGYSAGGDGVYQLAPRMADHFAAAAMMAGHPNDARPDGLRNLPFAIFMGGRDEAYSRNKVAADWGAQLDALQADDPEGYPHRLTIYPECGHWMNGQDREALPWMARWRRNVWPKKVVWRQDDVTHTRFYWLEVSHNEAAAGRTIVAHAEGQTISIDTQDVALVTLHLRDELIDLDQPVTVLANGRTVYEGSVRRTRQAIERSLAGWPDPRAASTAQVTVTCPLR